MIRVELWGQLKQKAGKAEFSVESCAEDSVEEVIRKFVEEVSELKGVLFDEEGGLRRSNLLFVDGAQVDCSSLIGGAQAITLMSPIAGG